MYHACVNCPIQFLSIVYYSESVAYFNGQTLLVIVFIDVLYRCVRLCKVNNDRQLYRCDTDTLSPSSVTHPDTISVPDGHC